MRRNVIRNRAAIRIGRKNSREDLLRAFERARTLLAIAIASEAKTTPLKRRQYYLDTAEQMRRFARRLRTAEGELAKDSPDWQRDLETIRQLPVDGRAMKLCQILKDIVRKIE
jgi:hypothetical protein